jgi:hypothetical protein
MRRIKLLVGLAVLGALVTAGIAVAKHSSSPRTDAVTATFTATRQSARDVACTGTDGAYVRERAVWTGSITGDPRLSGDLTIHVDSLDNLDTGLGASKGNVKIRNSSTGAKADLKFSSVDSGETSQGLLSGHVHRIGGTSPLPDGKLVANFQVSLSSETALSGELGGTGEAADPAVIQSGNCPAPHPAHPAKGPKGPKHPKH